ncbi:Os02g0822150 [Oryza sativa Japonica Group]|uniref:Os02g0822150 protein n=1 Tax=Oryza sativa subsp. japonica TaxID=39947 RepID=A0A0P0VRC1_ORYSJ|nr:Os02g0822150 [Oryza sativa Japonica Group]
MRASAAVMALHDMLRPNSSATSMLNVMTYTPVFHTVLFHCSMASSFSSTHRNACSSFILTPPPTPPRLWWIPTTTAASAASGLLLESPLLVTGTGFTGSNTSQSGDDSELPGCWWWWWWEEERGCDMVAGEKRWEVTSSSSTTSVGTGATTSTHFSSERWRQ